jgi:hypothetical protein
MFTRSCVSSDSVIGGLGSTQQCSARITGAISVKDLAVRGATNSMQNDRRKPPSSMLLRIWGYESIRFGRATSVQAGHSKTRRFHAGSGDQRAQEHAFRSHDANFFRLHFDELGQRAEVVAAVSARLGLHAPAGLAGETFSAPAV